MSGEAKRQAAEARVAFALGRIEEAQASFEEAAEALAGIAGMHRVWRYVSRLRDCARRSWCGVLGRADRLRHNGSLTLDREPDARETTRWC